MDTAQNAANDNMEMAFIDAATKLITYLKESNRAEDAAGAFVMTAYVKQMEDKLDAAMLQLAEMKGQLDQIQQEQNAELSPMFKRQRYYESMGIAA